MIKIWQQLEQCIPEGLFALVWTLYFYNCCPDCIASEKLNIYFWLTLSQINWLSNQSVYLPGMRITIIQVNSGFSYTLIYFIFKINFICINFKIYFSLFIIILIRFLAVTLFLFSPSVMSNSLWPHGLQHTRLPCPSTSPGASSNSSPLSQWCHPMISSSVIPFSSCLQSFPASESFLLSWLFTSGGQTIGASTSASLLPVNIQDWFSLGLIGLIFLQSKGLSRVFSNTTVQKH